MVRTIRGQEEDIILPFHKCEVKDWAKFSPPTSDSFATHKNYQENPDQELFCIDWEKVGH